MGIEIIFSTDQTFQQSHHHKLSDNVNEWDEQILGILSAVLPTELGVKPSLHWQKVDDNKGYGVGSVVLRSGKDSVGVPVIIKQWHLAPMDTILSGPHAYPLNSDTISEIFSGGGISEELISRTSGAQSFGAGSNNTMPPMSGRYTYSSDENSILQQIVDSIWSDDADEFRKTAGSENILASSHQNGTYHIFSALSKIAGKDKPKGKTSKKSIIQVRKLSRNKYGILGNPEGVYDPVMNTVNRPTMRNFVTSVVGAGDAEQETVSRVDHNGEVLLKHPSEKTDEKRNTDVGRPLGVHGEVLLYDTKEDQFKPESAKEFGLYKVKDMAGIMSTGLVFPNVVTLDGKKSSIKVFAGRSMSSIKPDIFGVPQPDEEFKLPKTRPEPGKMGILVHINEKGQALSTEPFRIVASTVFGESNEVLKIRDYRGNDASITFSPVAEGITKIKDTKMMPTASNIYVVPEKMKFIELFPEKAIATSADEHAKFASGRLSVNPLKVIRANDSYIFKAAGLEKYESVNGVDFDFNSLGASDAKFVLASFGCPLSRISDILTMPQNGSRTVHGLDLPKVASDRGSSRFDDAVRSLRVNLSKEASELDDADTVDTVLSLGFINTENVGKFIKYIPKLKSAISALSKLLIASRLGMNNIPESSSKTAINEIVKVVNGLKRIGLHMDKVDNR